MFAFVVVLIFSFISAVLSAAETALTAASRARLHSLSKKGNKRAALVLSLQKNMNQVIASILLANTVMLTSISALATMVFAKHLGEESILLAAFFLSALITIYLEVMPKAFVFARAETTAMRLAPLVSALLHFLSPMTRLINWIAHTSLKLFGVKTTEGTEHSTLEELQGAIELHQQKHPKERAMLKNILDLTCVTVAEIMIPKGHIFSLDCHLPTDVLIKRILSSPFSRIPLWEKDPDHIKGILHVKELYRALQKKSTTKLAVTPLLKKPWFIPETTTLIEQLQAFRKRREHLACVVDEYGALSGLVTLEDVLEEIVGDIKDEHDIPLTGVTVKDKGILWVEGTVTLRELSREYNWDVPDVSATTLAGLVMEEAGYIPKEHQTFTIANRRISVLKRFRNELKLLEVKPLPQLKREEA